MNFKVQLPQNAGNRISEVLDFKISRGRIPPDPPTSATFSASVNKTTGSAPVRHRCIVFHPNENIIFPGQLTPVFNFEGNFESGRIVCKEIPNKFTSCCFSHDNTKMVTNYATHLTVWNLLENKKIVSLSCRSELLSVLFSANDRFIGTTNISELCVYDTENRY